MMDEGVNKILSPELVERLESVGVVNATTNDWRCAGEKDKKYLPESGVGLSYCLNHDDGAKPVSLRRVTTTEDDAMVGQCRYCGTILWAAYTDKYSGGQPPERKFERSHKN